MKQSVEVVYLVDDDASFREALADLLEVVGMKVMTFESAEKSLGHAMKAGAVIT